MKAPINFPVQTAKVARWNFMAQYLILCQFYPDNPFYAIRPTFRGTASKPQEPGAPRHIVEHVNDIQALSGLKQWLSRTQHSEYRARMAWKQVISPRYSSEALTAVSKPLTHITKMYEALTWPHSFGVIYPEGVQVIIPQVKKIWVPEPLKDLSILEGTWKRYDFDSHIEYARLR